MRNIIWIISLFLLLQLQAGILSPLGIEPVSLLIVAVAVAVLLSDFRQALAIALIAGILLDFSSALVDGIMAMSVITAFLIMHLMLKEILSRDPNKFIIATSVAGVTVFYYLALLVFNWFFGLFNFTQGLDWSRILTVHMPIEMILNLFFTYPIFLYYSITQIIASKIPYDEESIRV